MVTKVTFNSLLSIRYFKEYRTKDFNDKTVTEKHSIMCRLNIRQNVNVDKGFM